jgi:hypothetical protein
MKLAPVQSFAQLTCKANRDQNYAKLVCIASQNLGGPNEPLAECLKFIKDTVQETGDEIGTIEEVNFCLDMVE